MATGIAGLRRVGIRWPEVNPVLIKEVRSRFRGPRAFWALTSFLILLTVFAYLLYWVRVGQTSNYYGYGRPYTVAAADIGRLIFGAVAFMEMLFMAFIAPALTMNAISSEVERQTYELLMATPLSAWSILRGKIGSALGYVLLLIFSALPVMSLAFLFGGVTLVEVALVQVSVFVSGLLFVTIGLFYSSLLKRTSRAAIMSYSTVAGLSLLPVFVLWVLAIASAFDLDEAMASLVIELSPFSSVVAIITDHYTGGSLYSGLAENLVLQVAFFQVVLAGMLYVIAGTRLRRVGRGAAISMGVLVGMLWIWVAWVLAYPPL